MKQVLRELKGGLQIDGPSFCTRNCKLDPEYTPLYHQVQALASLAFDVLPVSIQSPMLKYDWLAHTRPPVRCWIPDVHMAFTT